MPKRARDGRSRDKLPRLDWYPQDYLADTRVALMTLEQKGAYTDLLWRSWLDGPLPSDPKALARLLGVTPAKFRKIWSAIGSCFRENDDGNYVNPRLERERVLAQKKRQTARENGAKGGRPRKPKRNQPENPRETGRFSSGNRAGEPNESPSTVNRQPSTVTAPQPPTATELIRGGLGLDEDLPGDGGGGDPVMDLRKLYQQITTRWSWAPEDRVHDLELDLRTVIDREGLPAIRERFEAWCHEVAGGRAKSHLWAFLRHHAGGAADDPDAELIAEEVALRDREGRA